MMISPGDGMVEVPVLEFESFFWGGGTLFRLFFAYSSMLVRTLMENILYQ